MLSRSIRPFGVPQDRREISEIISKPSSTTVAKIDIFRLELAAMGKL
jgi:hypothetical protein